MKRLQRFSLCFLSFNNFAWLAIALFMGGFAGLITGVVFGWLFFNFGAAYKFTSLFGCMVAFMVWLAYAFYYAWGDSRSQPASRQIAFHPSPDPATHDMTNVVRFTPRRARQNPSDTYPPTAA